MLLQLVEGSEHAMEENVVLDHFVGVLEEEDDGTEVAQALGLFTFDSSHYLNMTKLEQQQCAGGFIAIGDTGPLHISMLGTPSSSSQDLSCKEKNRI